MTSEYPISLRADTPRGSVYMWVFLCIRVLVGVLFIRVPYYSGDQKETLI